MVAVKLGVVGLTAMDVLHRAISHFMYCTRNVSGTGSCTPKSERAMPCYVRVTECIHKMPEM